MELTSDSWNSRYVKNETGWDVGEVSTPLKTYFDQLTDKALRILIPGSGNGHEAEYLFNHGFKNVFLLDWAISPLHHFHHRVKDFPVEHLIHEDFFQHCGQYDLIIEQTFFCALDPKLRPAYAKQMNALLKDGSANQKVISASEPPHPAPLPREREPGDLYIVPNKAQESSPSPTGRGTASPASGMQGEVSAGKLVGMLFDNVPNNDPPPYGGNREEYVSYFTPYFTIQYFDRCYNSIEKRAGRELFIHLVKKKTDA